MHKNELLSEFFLKKNYDILKNILKNSVDKYELDYLAKVFVAQGDYASAAVVYKNIGFMYEYGRCELLQGNLDSAKDIWCTIKTDTPATLWGKSLLEFIDLYVKHIPTFFQIRAFLEVDLDALLNANLITYCENIVNGAHLFEQNNQESYKFIGRVFINNSYFDLAELFLQKAKEICYVDPEVHLMLAKCWLNKNDIQRARESLLLSVEKGYGYYPARKMLESLDNTLNKK